MEENQLLETILLYIYISFEQDKIFLFSLNKLPRKGNFITSLPGF